MSNLVFSIKKIIFSLYASIFASVSKLTPFPKVEVIKGKAATEEIARLFKSKGIRRPIIITDTGIAQLQLHQPLIEALSSQGMAVAVFSDIHPDPNFGIIRKGIEACKNHNYDAMLAIGGGSSMDAAKIINICAKHNKNPRSLPGLFKVFRKGALFACIPTTAGTGSEVTIVAVVTDEKTQQKKSCIAPCFRPDYAVLDASLLRGLPPAIVAATGVDALTHAIEAFINRGGNTSTNRNALTAIKLIFENLPAAVNEPDNFQAKENMLYASHLAGLAFTRANVGWVHAIAHQLGGIYHTPHGLANAIVLPKILAFYNPKVDASLAAIAHAAGLAKTTDSNQDAADALVQTIIAMNRDIGIPSILGDLKATDIPLIVRRATAEAYTTPFPVPKYFKSQAEIESLLCTLLPVE